MVGFETDEESEHWRLSPAPPLRVLVVDDNIGSAQMMSIMLTKFWKHDVRIAHDGQQALEIAQEHRPDVVFLDIGLPIISGYEVARLLRENPEFHQTLLVALTGYDEDEDRRRAQEAGFDEHLVKPASAGSLQQLFIHPKLERGD
jgi:CheY-like chemotaxis protein